MKIVFAIDSFKGCMSSADAASACADALRRHYPSDTGVAVPVADGGEGTIEAISSRLDVLARTCPACDPFGRHLEASYVCSRDGHTAYIALSEASGLPLLAADERNPLKTTTFGTGMQVAHAIASGCREIVLCAGGSATVDGGTGILQALGAVFYDSSHHRLGRGGEILGRIADVDTTKLVQTVRGIKFTVLCDVDNPLTGPSGAALVFGPQKGASADTACLLENGMCNYARFLGKEAAESPGAGAAGGVGAAVKGFLGGRLASGAQEVLRMTGFDRLISDASLVVTGEGRMDATTLRGKTPYAVMCAARKKGIPCLALAGQLCDRQALLDAGFAGIKCITPAHTPLELAMERSMAMRNIARAFIECMPRE